jgi:hypothetical protein
VPFEEEDESELEEDELGCAGGVPPDEEADESELDEDELGWSGGVPPGCWPFEELELAESLESEDEEELEESELELDEEEPAWSGGLPLGGLPPCASGGALDDAALESDEDEDELCEQALSGTTVATSATATSPALAFFQSGTCSILRFARDDAACLMETGLVCSLAVSLSLLDSSVSFSSTMTISFCSVIPNSQCWQQASATC